MFNLIHHRVDLESSKVLDLFAGTGALGLEALSRGCSSVTFVENNPAMLDLVRRNVGILAPDAQVQLEKRDASEFLKRLEDSGTDNLFDLILADPPYDWSGFPELPEQVIPCLQENGLFVLEHGRHTHFDDHVLLETTRAYGRSRVSLFRKAAP